MFLFWSLLGIGPWARDYVVRCAVALAIGLALGALGPGCAAPSRDEGPGEGEDVATSESELESSGRICASPAGGGPICVGENEGIALAWNRAAAKKKWPIEMWAEWPSGTTLDQLVSRRAALQAWFAKNDTILKFIRDEKKSAESYRATLAGKMGALMKQARDRQAQLLAKPDADPIARFEKALTDKAAAEKTPLSADLAKDRQSSRAAQAEWDRAVADVEPLSQAYARVVTQYEAYRETETAETAAYAALTREASESTNDTIDSVEDRVIAAAEEWRAKPNDLQEEAARIAGQMDAFAVELRRRLAPHSGFMQSSAVTPPDMTSSALRSLGAMLAYVQTRTAHGEATINALLEDLAARIAAVAGGGQ